jgi:hypothetical protein
MVGALDTSLNLPLNKYKVPDVRGSKDSAEILKIAEDFSSVFFSEYVGIMLDEVENDDEDGSNDLYKTLHSQVVGKELVNSGAGRQVTDYVMAAIKMMQARA